uniref:DNA-directed RNA polymerase subunit beta'' n=1 Tax=Schizocladia ischiensis TaxID=196139 RepID=A0A7U3NQV8_9STRA|nr:RNA polymerase beta'' subunit [Schizocladia ischiensis]QOW07524.1 RNA polymerase beta'' subunit [Schizocladia ischiensis]
MIEQSNLFCNNVLNKKELKTIIAWAFKNFGSLKAAYLVDELKDIGFQYATKAGISISLEDLKIPPSKTNLVRDALANTVEAEWETIKGEISEVERLQKVINIWNITSETLKERVIKYFQEKDPLNSVYIMAFSGARGNISQVRQLVGMRGLMSDPNGQIIDIPIQSNFREGLSITDYIISSYGARKGLVDTAIKTADSGYLTRRLVDIAQSVVIRELDCRSQRGIKIKEIIEDNDILFSLQERIVGRVLACNIIDPRTKTIIAYKNELITPRLAEKIMKYNNNSIIVRSPLTCECRRSICQKCYGNNLATGNLVELGEPVGIIAAQSIGEPGTQLTMRTFHTGGVFTSDFSRQVRAQCSGYIKFSSTLNTRELRTNYGKDVLVCENQSFIKLITYTNQIKEIKIFPKSIIIVGNNSFVKKNDILFELPPKNKMMQDDASALNDVIAKQSGEIIIEKQNFFNQNKTLNVRKSNIVHNLVWILSGYVTKIPFATKLKIYPLMNISKNQNLTQSKITNKFSGYIKFIKNLNTSKIIRFKLISSLGMCQKQKIILESKDTKITQCKIYLAKFGSIYLNPYPLDKSVLTLGCLKLLKYKTKTGGNFYSTNSQRTEYGSSVFYIPESTYNINFDVTALKVNFGDYVNKKTEIYKNYFIDIAGIIQFDETKPNNREIIIKPGYIIPFPNSLIDILEYDGQIFYPGEIIFDNFEINTASYIEVCSIKNNLFLLLRPVIRYEIPNPENFNNFFPNWFDPHQIELDQVPLNLISEMKIKTENPIYFIKHHFFINFLENYSNIFFEINQATQPDNYGYFKLILGTNIIPEKILPKEMFKEEVRLSLFIQDKQFVEQETLLASFDVIIPFATTVLGIKKQIKNKQKKILLTTEQDYKVIFIEDTDFQLKNNQLIKLGKKIGTNFFNKESRLIEQISGNKITFRISHPYLFSKGAQLRIESGDLIKLKDVLGQLVYERLITGDIVQGLPRVEEILEARHPKVEAKVAPYPGIITKVIEHQVNTLIWIKHKGSRFDQLINIEGSPNSIQGSPNLLIRKFDFVNVCQCLTEGTLNPHTILDVYFQYYCSIKILSMYQASYYSFKKVQFFLLNSVQAVYYSQGVFIADKHLEIIIKQMTNRIEIIYPGDTNFLSGDLLELEQVRYINACLSKKRKIYFKPILLGITKSALKAEGFLSAASFQYTTRVLTQASIEGRVDWITGLKENVIVGKLIPCGTGFYSNNDFSYLKVKMPTLNNNHNSNIKNDDQTKHHKLRSAIKFRYRI